MKVIVTNLSSTILAVPDPFNLHLRGNKGVTVILNDSQVMRAKQSAAVAKLVNARLMSLVYDSDSDSPQVVVSPVGAKPEPDHRQKLTAPVVAAPADRDGSIQEMDIRQAAEKLAQGASLTAANPPAPEPAAEEKKSKKSKKNGLRTLPVVESQPEPAPEVPVEPAPAPVEVAPAPAAEPAPAPAEASEVAPEAAPEAQIAPAASEEAPATSSEPPAPKKSGKKKPA